MAISLPSKWGAKRQRVFPAAPFVLMRTCGFSNSIPPSTGIFFAACQSRATCLELTTHSNARKQVNANQQPRPKRRFWRLCRIYFRRFRITVWFLILALLGVLIYVNQIGLPGFIKKPLLEKLRTAGIDLQFTRLRLRWYEGVVAENVQFGQTCKSFGPQLKLEEVQLQLNRRALSKFRLQ